MSDKTFDQIMKASIAISLVFILIVLTSVYDPEHNAIRLVEIITIDRK